MEPEPGPAGRAGAGIDNFPGHSRQSGIFQFPTRTLLGRAMRKAQSAKRKLLAFCILRAQEFQGESDSTRNGDRGPGGLFALPCALCLAPSTCTPIFDHVFDVPRVSFARACPPRTSPREARFFSLKKNHSFPLKASQHTSS